MSKNKRLNDRRVHNKVKQGGVQISFAVPLNELRGQSKPRSQSFQEGALFLANIACLTPQAIKGKYEAFESQCEGERESQLRIETKSVPPQLARYTETMHRLIRRSSHGVLGFRVAATPSTLLMPIFRHNNCQESSKLKSLNHAVKTR